MRGLIPGNYINLGSLKVVAIFDIKSLLYSKFEILELQLRTGETFKLSNSLLERAE